MPYDRAAAMDYARKYWDRPCDDGVFWLTGEPINVEKERKRLGAKAADGWEARFVPVVEGSGYVEEAAFIRPKPGGATIPLLGGTWEKKTIAPWAGLADCAHYLSKCLNAGGVNSSSLGVGELVRKLQERADTKTLCEKVSKDGAQRVVDSGIFDKGDMVGYFNIDPDGDYSGARRYTHSTMYVGKFDGKGRITCHTKSRFGRQYYDDEWFLHAGSYEYTLIHIASDDPPPAVATSKRLAGWWTVTYPGRTEYYKFESTGSVRYTLSKPKKKDSPISAAGSGYWFERGQELIVIWRKTGTVDRWDLSASGNTIPITVNGNAGSATRTF
jgi:hypothetical protein